MVYTDHRNLEYIKKAQRLNPRQARWAMLFTHHFIITASFRPGSKNIKADALSRIYDGEAPASPVTIISPTCLVAPIRWDLDREIEEAAGQDPEPEGCPPGRTYVPRSVRTKIVNWAHSAPATGHLGVTRTQQLLSLSLLVAVPPSGGRGVCFVMFCVCAGQGTTPSTHRDSRTTACAATSLVSPLCTDVPISDRTSVV